MPTLIPLFTAIPSPTNTRAEFTANAFQLASEYNPFVNAANAQAAENNAAAIAVADDADAANDARIAAEAAAASASTTAGATQWISGKNYVAGEVTWSPVSFLTYRRRTNGAGAIDPSNDPANWEPLIRDTVGAVLSLAAGNTAGVLYATHVFTGLVSTVTLPASPAVGNWLGFASASTPVAGQTINRNGNVVMGLAEDLGVDRQSPFRLVYSGPSKGWVIAT